MSEPEGYDFVDGLLKDAGEEWRARLAPPPAVDETWFAREAPARRLWAAAAAAAAVAVLAAAIALLPAIAPPAATLPPAASLPTATSMPPASSLISESTPSPPTIAIATPSPTPVRTAPPTSSPPAALRHGIVREGDLVSITGQIIDWSAGPVICTYMAWDLSNPPQPGCFDARDLPVTGVDPRDMSGADWRSALEDFENVWVTDPLRVFGTWRGGTIEFVDSIPATMPPSPFSSVPVPCDPPAGGWPGDPHEYADSDIIRRRLQSEVDRHPELYAGLWSASSRDSRGHVFSAMVVGTVGEVSSVEANLRAIFPANLCVVQVQYNTLELEAEHERWSAEDRGWVVFPEPKINRVAVWLPAILDQSTADLLAQADGKVRVFPIAERLGADPPSRGQRLCPFTDPAQCAYLVALVREARPDLFTPDSIEIVDITSCRPGMMSCPFLVSYIVVVVAPRCAGGPVAFSVEPRRRDVVKAIARDHELPSFVAELLPAECGPGPPP